MFAPFILILQNWMGTTQFRQLRGQAIARHAQVIKAFCEQFHLKPARRQKLLKLAHNNGKCLGLMA